MTSSMQAMRKAISAHNTKNHYKMSRAQLEDVVLRKMIEAPKMKKSPPKKKAKKPVAPKPRRSKRTKR